jgi:hypothetical protein
MFQVVPEPEFEAWYESLPVPLAEEVAAALDLVAAGSELPAPDDVSPLLLWFDGSGPDRGLALAPGLPIARAHTFLTWHREVLACLESTAFRERLLGLDGLRLAAALERVERLKRRIHAARLSSSFSPWREPGEPPGPFARDPSGVRAAFLDLLELVGLDARVALTQSGLRELSLARTTPRLRVLFGLDLPRRRLIAIWGERLNRRYYGDSVRFAERRWQEYCADADAAQSSRAP